MTVGNAITKNKSRQLFHSNPKRQGIKKGKSHKKWFDEECRLQKRKTNELANKKHNNPQNNQIRQEHRSALKYYKQLCNSKKYIFWKKETCNLDKALDSNDFWNTWKTIGSYKPNKQKLINPDGKRRENFFTNLYRNHIDQNIDDILIKSHQEINENLNKKISMNELTINIKKFENNKATGPDRIRNEFIKHAPSNILNIILQFLNLNIEKGLVASNWCLDFISPIHKEGSLEVPENYRDLIIMNTLLKLLCAILNRRLTKFCEDNNFISKEQIGFCKHAGTSYHIFTLKP